jgi:hypothetical protein
MVLFMCHQRGGHRLHRHGKDKRDLCIFKSNLFSDINCNQKFFAIGMTVKQIKRYHIIYLNFDQELEISEG